jgi:hypothetical protein
MKNHVPNVSLLGLVVLCACGSSQGERVRDAHMEQIEDQTAAKQESIEKSHDNQAERIEQGYDAQKDRVAKSDAPGSDATKTLVGVSEERAKYESDARERLNKLATRIDAAQQKIQVLGPRAPTPLKTELETTAQQYNLLKTDVMNLESTPPAEWEQKKKDIDNRVSLLDDRVSKLTDKIDDV